MGKCLDLSASFDEYINEIEGFSSREMRFLEDCDDAPGGEKGAAMLVKWLRAAYIQGARAMAQDTLDTLGDYACAVAGLEEKKYDASGAYDAAHASLHVYFTQVLNDAEN